LEDACWVDVRGVARRMTGQGVRYDMMCGAVALLCIATGSVLAQATGPWRVISNSKFPTVVAYDTTRVTRLPHGQADVWERFALHPPRHDPSGVVGSIVMQVVVDCPAQQSAVRSIARYAPDGKVISQTATFPIHVDDFTTENPGSVEESALQGLCAALHLSH
jgi:hypothetical protein